MTPFIIPVQQERSSIKYFNLTRYPPSAIEVSSGLATTSTGKKAQTQAEHSRSTVFRPQRKTVGTPMPESAPE
jgi:hypothetical protein